jgi:hypothetical protein
VFHGRLRKYIQEEDEDMDVNVDEGED